MLTLDSSLPFADPDEFAVPGDNDSRFVPTLAPFIDDTYLLPLYDKEQQQRQQQKQEPKTTATASLAPQLLPPLSPASVSSYHCASASSVSSVSTLPSSVGTAHSTTLASSPCQNSQRDFGSDPPVASEFDYVPLSGGMSYPYNISDFVDPSLIHSMDQNAPYAYPSFSPVPSSISQLQVPAYAKGPAPPSALAGFHTNQQTVFRPSSVCSGHSYQSHYSWGGDGTDSAEPLDDGQQNGRCPIPECGRFFKDLKAHMLTHQSERPEKCPITTCIYHLKGFARKYDKNRHTLTHYKGTMVCGFCPVTCEKSFNRADVFKRHLTSVHGVDQPAPNSRKRSSPSASSSTIAAASNTSNTTSSSFKSNPLTACSQDASGKCSTCGAIFGNAQDFYEHLDDCVLRVVQQQEPSEAINAQRLSEIASDQDVRDTMQRHMLLDSAADMIHDDHDYDDDDQNDILNNSNAAIASPNVRPEKSQHPMPATMRRRGNRKRGLPMGVEDCPPQEMKRKRRVICMFDGPRRLWKDELGLDRRVDFELKLPMPDIHGRNVFISSLDVESLRRAEGVFSATDDEKGPWMPESEATAGRLIGPLVRRLPPAPNNPVLPLLDVNTDEFAS